MDVFDDYKYDGKELPRMDAQRNLMLAKKYMVESVFRAANVEGIGVTFPETQAICDGMSVGGYKIEEVEAVVDLKHAWQWCFTNHQAQISLDTLQTINRIAGKMTVINAGSLRDQCDAPVYVTLRYGERYAPPLSQVDAISQDLVSLLASEDALDNALELFCYVAKGQFFNDGNKRTATVVTNLYMIQNGLGIFSIPPEKKLEFYNFLTDFYGDDVCKEDLKDFLHRYCLTFSED